MKIPGVASVVAGVTGGAAQVVRAGVSTAAGAAGAVQMLASPVVELAGPVVQSVANSTGRALGIEFPNGSPNSTAPPVRWQSGQRVHLDLDPLLPFPALARLCGGSGGAGSQDSGRGQGPCRGLIGPVGGRTRR